MIFIILAYARQVSCVQDFYNHEGGVHCTVTLFSMCLKLLIYLYIVIYFKC